MSIQENKELFNVANNIIPLLKNLSQIQIQNVFFIINWTIKNSPVEIKDVLVSQQSFLNGDVRFESDKPIG